MATGRAHDGSAQRLVLQPLAVFEVLLSRGFQLAQVLLRMREIRIDPIVADLRALGTRDAHDLLHHRAQQLYGLGIVENFADPPARESRNSIERAVPD